MLAGAHDGAYAVDMNQSIIFWNHAAEGILGFTAQEALGKRCCHVFKGVSEDDKLVCAARCEAILWAKEGRVAPAQNIRVLTQSGEPKWLSVVHFLLPAPRLENSTLVHVFHEVTEEIEAKRLMRRLGQILSVSPAIPVMPGFSVRQRRDGVAHLTSKEVEILRLLSRGASTKEIAQELVVSISTVRNHIQNILSKLEAHSRLEAVAIASRYGVLQPPQP
jgi:PAS domain S-box-containing protein